MKQICYPTRFIELLNNFHGVAPNNYIGQGNPGAQILIIGKECTAQNNERGNFFDFEINMNFETWQRNCKNGVKFCDVSDWDSTPLPFEEKYNPLFPYNSWWFGGRGPHGSRTWDGYQSMINHIYPEHRIQTHCSYNLWKYCFITELSTNNMKNSRHINDNTASSINTRLSDSGILRNTFFQQFPIIICAFHHYKDIYNIDIEKCFNTKFISNLSYDKNGEFIFVHTDTGSITQYKRLLLHTNHAIQFYGNGLHSNEYYNALGNICRRFISGNQLSF